MDKRSRSTVCPECEIGSLTRNNYFTGKLLVERDFKDEQRYYIDKLRLHQKRLHGEGVVCGLQVRPHSSGACQNRFVMVDPGFAKDCCGNDIVVPEREYVDITQFKSWIKLQKAQATAAAAGIGASHTLQICVHYKECPVENIPVLYDDCGCDDTACAPNRILESYEFDLTVDPKITGKKGCLPQLTAGPAVNVAGGASALSFDPSRTYLYALSSAVPSTVYKMDPTGQVNISGLNHALPGAGKALAVSDDGALVYAISFDSGSSQSSLIVLNASDLSLAGTSALVADNATPASLAAISATKVAWLKTATPQLLTFDASASPPTQSQSIALSGSPTGLVLGLDRTKAYYVDSAASQIGAADLTAGTTLAPLTVVADPARVVLANLSGPDVLAVVDQANSTISAVQANPATILANISLFDQPVAAGADPQKKVLYVVTQSTASPGTYTLQPFDLKTLVAGSPELPPAGVPTVQPANAAAVVSDGSEVFVIGAGGPGQGTTAGVQASAPGCPDLYVLEDCEDCCTADCLVLATIRGYQPGFSIQAQQTPPTDPAADFAAQVARIDNRLGRIILPSTNRIAEVLEAVAACGCGCDCTGQSTTVVTTTTPVIGLNPNLPKIIDIGWNGNGAIVAWSDFLSNRFNAPPTQLNPKQTPLLTIYFNQAMAGIDRQSFRVEITYPQMEAASDGSLAFSGLYNRFRIQPYGQLVELVALGLTETPNTHETPASAWAFIPYSEFWLTLGKLNIWTAASYQNPPWQALDLPCVRVTLSGDFVYTKGAFAESGMLDGDNIGGMVGNPTYPRPGPITGGKNPSGDMVEGGNFESWFYLQPPPSDSGSLTHLNVNNASSSDLQTLPGVDATLAKKILAERKKTPFTNLVDLQNRLALPADVAAKLSALVSF